VRASAQGLFNVMILGVGTLIANSTGPWLLQTVFTQGGVTDFRSMFMIPIVISIVSALVLAAGFRPPEKLAVKEMA
jgi:MFS family permease